MGSAISCELKAMTTRSSTVTLDARTSVPIRLDWQ